MADEALAVVPESRRQHWLTPATIFAGLEFTIPVLMVGASLAGNFSLLTAFIISVIALVGVSWPGNVLAGYAGARSGRAASVLAGAAFGQNQARFLIGGIIALMGIGWWAIQTALAGNAIAAMLGVDYGQERMTWAILVIACGLLFAIPAVLGYQSMKWTDYVAVPAGLVLVLAGLYLSFTTIGWQKLSSWSPEPMISWSEAISLVVGLNAAQWLIAPDYTRYARPRLRDNVLIPLGIVAIGLPLLLVGSLMSVGMGNADIVAVMVGLGFPIWGFLILWLATWTSQIVNNYSSGLALANLFGVGSSRGRALVTLLAAGVGVFIALAGILGHFMQVLQVIGVVVPAVAGVILGDHYLVRRQRWVERPGWNGLATLAASIGLTVGYITQYVAPIGLPAVQALMTAAVASWALASLKGRLARAA